MRRSAGFGSAGRHATRHIRVRGAARAGESRASSVTDITGPFEARVAVLLEATNAGIDRVRAERSEEDFGVIADDLMFDRAAAVEYP